MIPTVGYARDKSKFAQVSSEINNYLVNANKYALSTFDKTLSAISLKINQACNTGYYDIKFDIVRYTGANDIDLLIFERSGILRGVLTSFGYYVKVTGEIKKGYMSTLVISWED